MIFLLLLLLPLLHRQVKRTKMVRRYAPIKCNTGIPGEQR